MSTYYKSKNTVYMVDSIAEWRGKSAIILRSANTSETARSPFNLVRKRDAEWCTKAEAAK